MKTTVVRGFELGQPHVFEQKKKSYLGTNRNASPSLAGGSVFDISIYRWARCAYPLQTPMPISLNILSLRFLSSPLVGKRDIVVTIFVWCMCMSP